MDKRKLLETEKLRLKDRGDVLRKQKQRELELSKNLPDRGDIIRSKCMKPNDKLHPSRPEHKNPDCKEEQHKVELISQSTFTGKELYTPLPKTVEKPETQPQYECVEYRKRIRDRYTLKPKVQKADDGKKEELTNREELSTTKKSNSEPKERTKSKESLETRLTKSDKTKTDNNSIRKPPSIKRKPIIKTITSKNDSSRVYKAVTFVEQTKVKPLQIKIPSEPKKVKSKQKLSKKDVHIQIHPSRVSVEKMAKKRKTIKKPNKREAFPNFPTQDISSAKILSPETEVAKWSNSSNNHTMPYYEAWVNTTLAAISKYSKKDKLYLERQNLMSTFRRQWQQRQMSPELIYDKFDDERYTGRIKVRQALK